MNTDLIEAKLIIERDKLAKLEAKQSAFERVIGMRLRAGCIEADAHRLVSKAEELNQRAQHVDDDTASRKKAVKAKIETLEALLTAAT